MNVFRQVQNFLYLVSDHRRVNELASIIEAFEHRIDDRLGFVQRRCVQRAGNERGQKVALQAQFTRLTGKKARLRFTTDPSLLAGLVAKVGSTVYDGSARGQLERLKVRLGSQ